MDKLFKGDHIKSTTSGDIYEVVNVDVDRDDLEVVLIWSTMNDTLGEPKKFSYDHTIKSPFWKKIFEVKTAIRDEKDFITPEKYTMKLDESKSIKPFYEQPLPILRSDWTFCYPFKNNVTVNKNNTTYTVDIDSILSNIVVVNITISGKRYPEGITSMEELEYLNFKQEEYKYEYIMKLDKTMYESLMSDIPAFCTKFLLK